tara:strand:+ start:261 stop:632 length:372 start_codon:yes stop_codon:yes gene_type:complete
MGRPSKLTPEVQENIARAITAGNYQDVAAQYAGISPATFYLWMQKAEDGKHPFLEFSEAIKKAHADYEVRNVAIIGSAAQKTWQAAAWLLERRNPDRWANKEKRELVGASNGPIEIRVVYEDE